MIKKRLSLVLVLLFAVGMASGQSDLCFKNSKGLYWPVQVGLKQKYASSGESYLSYFTSDSLKFGDHS